MTLNNTLFRIFFYTALILLFSSSLFGQSNGSEFGQNRVQYYPTQWQTLSSGQIDIVFQDSAIITAEYALNKAREETVRVETLLAYKYGSTMQIVVFNSLNNFRQSNFGYVNPQMNSGGFVNIPNDAAHIYFNGNYHDFEQQIRNAVCDIILREMIFGGSLQDRLERVKSSPLPYWFTKGLSDYIAEGWNAEKENALKDGFSLRKYNNFNMLSASEQALAGCSIWKYCAETYGIESISTITFIARYTNSAEAAFYFQTKNTLKELLKSWRESCELQFAVQSGQILPKGEATIAKNLRKKEQTHVSLSHNGELVSLVTQDNGRHTLWIYNIKSGSVKKLYSGGQKVLNQVADKQLPVVRWNSVNGGLAILSYEKGRYVLLSFDNKLNKKDHFTFTQFTGLNDFCFGRNSGEIVLSATSNGHSDLYLFDLKTSEYSKLSADIYHDHSPVLNEDFSKLYYVSNGPHCDTCNYQSGVFNVFEMDMNTKKSRPITLYNKENKITYPIVYKNNNIGYLSDISGIVNAYIVKSDSMSEPVGQTNYSRNILGQSVAHSASSLVELILMNGKYTLYQSVVPANPFLESTNVTTAKWKQTYMNPDTMLMNRKNGGLDLRMNNDSVQFAKIDTSGRQYHLQTGFKKNDYSTITGTETSIPQASVSKFVDKLQPEFILSQSDNRNLGSYKQNIDIYRNALRNPTIMPYSKISLSDALKNNILEIGARISLDLSISDYEFSAKSLKRRLDHAVYIGRHSRKFENAQAIYKQNISTQFHYEISLPVNENNRFALQTGLRHESLIAKGTETFTLEIPDINKTFGTVKLEYVHDNTISLGLNMLKGKKLQAGFEVIDRFNHGFTIQNFYLDARMYIPIYGKIIWANRVSAVYASGSGKVSYYLGAVENWTEKEQFSRNTGTLNSNQYQFQQWVSNLRGFNRGIRMGSSYALLNSEIRIPVFQQFRKTPMVNEFFKNFTITAFADIGTAFIDRTPSSENNPFNTVTYDYPNYTLTVTSRRNPYVLGTGFGVRTLILGYFIKYDRGYGYVEKQWQQPLNYISLGFDF